MYRLGAIHKWRRNIELKKLMKADEEDQGTSEKKMNDKKSNDLREFIQKRP